MDDAEAWVVIVPPLVPTEAEKRFSRWKRQQEKKGHTIRPEDVRRDQINKGAGEGCVVRYLARKKPV